VSGGKFARKHVPLNLRQILSAESAANDGLAYPFLSLAIYLTIDRTRGIAFTHWVLIGWLCMDTLLHCPNHLTIKYFLDQVVLGVVLGAVLGALPGISVLLVYL